MYVQKIHPNARIPSVQHDNSFLVYASEDVKIPAHGDAIISTGLYVVAPANHAVRTISCNEAFSHNLEVSSFCSVNYPNPHHPQTSPKPVELSLKVYNHGKSEYRVKAGSPIGRILLIPTFTFEVLETDVAEILRDPPKTADRLEKKISAPKTALAWFKKMYKEDYNYIRAQFLSEKVVKEVEDYKLTPNYRTSTNRENLEAAWAWSLLDEAVKERIRREMIIRNEQEERVSQMAGTDMIRVGKKAAAKSKVAEEQDSEGESEGNPEEESEEDEPAAKPSAGSAPAPEEDDEDENDEPTPEPAPAPAPAPKTAPEPAPEPVPAAIPSVSKPPARRTVVLVRGGRRKNATIS